MNWSWKLGRLAGIDVYMHWTFLLLLGYVGLSDLQESGSVLAAAKGVALVVAVFICIVLHEFGHALTARHCGIPTRDITLLPIGGVARLERMPDDPRQELWVALAGPAVNVVIAGLLAAILVPLGMAYQMPKGVFEAPFLQSLLIINIGLIFFNMLPAFPMDGGRVLRALLAHWLDYGRATDIAARVGQGMAILFAIGGFFGNPMLLLIAVFVFFGAAAEARNVRSRLMMAGALVRDAMNPRPLTIPPDATLLQVADHLMSGPQRDFPVVVDDRLLGMLRRDELMQALNHGRAGTYVGENLTGNGEAADEAEMLDRVLERMGQRGVTSMPVTQEGRFVGLLTPESVGQFFSIRAANRAGAG